jgi:[acyl-carrier-protein] S-malonyltransferase
MSFAFFFPGQGSQSVGMMQGFGDSRVIRDTFVEASDLLSTDFWHMATEASDAINQTINTQPLMLTASIAVWRAWQKEGGEVPAILAGHSLGEYSALVAAGTISFKDALPLVRFRADVMQSAVAEGIGAMAAVLGLDDEAVRAVCAEAAQGEVLEAVNLNSPGQVVIAGHKTAVERGMALAKEKGAKRALPLPVSVPSHCALMKPAAEELRGYLQDVAINTSAISVLHNADVASYSDAAQIKDALVRQLYSPVRWVETVQFIRQQGIKASAECGPGKVLAGLAKRIVDDMTCVPLISQESLAEAQAQFNASLHQQ